MGDTVNKFIDVNSYNSHSLYANQGKSTIWLRGYDDGFSGAVNTSNNTEYLLGYAIGKKDKEREQNSPWMKGGKIYRTEWDKPDET